MFNRGVYTHSNAVHNLLSTMRVGVIRGGCEVEIRNGPKEELKTESLTLASTARTKPRVRILFIS